MRQPLRLKNSEVPVGNRAVGGYRYLPNIGDVVKRRGMPESGEKLLTRRREVRVYGVLHTVQGQPLHDARKTKAVVAVEVRQAQPGDAARRHAGPQHLPLRALPGIEQNALAIPAQQVTVVITMTRRYLTGGAQHHQ